MKKFVSLFLALVMLMALTACGGESSAPEASAPAEKEAATEVTAIEDIHLGVQLINSTEFALELGDIAKNYALELGVGEVTVVSNPTDGAGVETEMDCIESLIAAGCNAIMWMPYDTTASVATAQRIEEEGLPQIFVNTRTDYEGESVVTFVGVNETESFYQDTKQFAKNFLTKDSNVLIVTLDSSNTQHTERAAGIHQGLDELGCSWVEIYPFDGSLESFSNGAESYLVSNGPENFDAVCVTSDSFGVPIASIVHNNGWDHIKIMGYDGDQSARQFVKDGLLAQTMYQPAETMIKTTVDSILGSILEGKEYPDFIALEGVIIDSSNIDEFLQ